MVWETREGRGGETNSRNSCQRRHISSGNTVDRREEWCGRRPAPPCTPSLGPVVLVVVRPVLLRRAALLGRTEGNHRYGVHNTASFQTQARSVRLEGDKSHTRTQARVRLVVDRRTPSSREVGLGNNRSIVYAAAHPRRKGATNTKIATDRRLGRIWTKRYDVRTRDLLGLMLRLERGGGRRNGSRNRTKRGEYQRK
jgi:hypothetical protein